MNQRNLLKARRRMWAEEREKWAEIEHLCSVIANTLADERYPQSTLDALLTKREELIAIRGAIAAITVIIDNPDTGVL